MNIELYEKETSLAIKVLFTTIAAFIVSGVIVRTVAVNIPSTSSSSIDEYKWVTSHLTNKSLTTYKDIWEKSVFNPEGLTSTATTEIAEMKEVEMKTEINVPLSSLNYILIGTVAGANFHSFAVIKSPSVASQELYRRGDKVGPATIVAIERNRVILNNAGREEMLEVLYESKTAPLRKNAISRTVSRGKGVRKISANKFILDKKEVDALSGDMSHFMAQARVIPNIVAGKSSGYKLLNIQKGSLVDSIGIKNGDVVKKINGLTIDNPEKAFTVYRQILEGGSFTVEIERGGKPETIGYEIR